MEHKEFFDLTYSDEPASYYILSLEIDDNGVKAFWYHRNKNLVTGFAEYPFQKGSIKEAIQNLVQEHPFLRSDFEQTIVSIRTENFALIPNIIESSEDLDLFQVTNEFNGETDSLRSYSLINLKARILFSISKELEEAIYKAFIHVNIIPHVAPRIEFALNDLKSKIASELILAHISSDRVDVLIFRNNKLALCNSFYQTSKEDLVYYTLYCAEILEITPQKHHLVLSGDIAIGDENWKVISSYWKKLKIASGLENIDVSNQLNITENARFDYLTHSLLCAL